MIAHLIAHRSANDDAVSGHPDGGQTGNDDRPETTEGTSDDTDSRLGPGAPETGRRSNPEPVDENSRADGDTDTTGQDGAISGGGGIGPADATSQDTISGGGGIERAAGAALTSDPAPEESAQPPSRSVGDDEREDQRVGVEVRVEVSTLLGRDEHPGELAG